jgi:TetR/AcrR family transcriptional regulator, transcriptional repressor for nem operon
VGVAEVMSRLGLTHGGFYAHFESKDDLIAQAITYMLDETFARFLHKTEGVNPQDGLAAFIDYYLSTVHRDTPSRGCRRQGASGSG